MELALSNSPTRSHSSRSEGSGAAVAAVLRQTEQLDVLLIRRSERPGDPWSGHVAFPGGRIDPGDASPRAAAVRETMEEVGLDLLRHGRPLGALSPQPAVGRGRRVGFDIHPFVYAVEPEHPPLVPDPSEVSTTLWVPMAFLADRAQRSIYRHRHEEVVYELPCYRYEGHLIWGLTLRMLDELVDVGRR